MGAHKEADGELVSRAQPLVCHFLWKEQTSRSSVKDITHMVLTIAGDPGKGGSREIISLPLIVFGRNIRADERTPATAQGLPQNEMEEQCEEGWGELPWCTPGQKAMNSLQKKRKGSIFAYRCSSEVPQMQITFFR